jgi:phytoene synthase
VSVEACADLVERGDPERFRTVLVAPRDKRPGLIVLYAFNLEIARAAFLSRDPLIVRMRLQFWLDALGTIAAGGPAPAHAVAAPLAEIMRASALPVGPFEAMVRARQQDADPEPPADQAALEAYIDATWGGLMELAARHLGAEGEAVPVIRRFAQGAGAAAYLSAVPALVARGRAPLPPGLDPSRFARDARRALAEARARRNAVPRACLAALLPGWRADAILGRAAAGQPLDSLEPSPFRSRAVLLLRAFSGRW